jgi:hypothetical protein
MEDRERTDEQSRENSLKTEREVMNNRENSWKIERELMEVEGEDKLIYL